MWLNGRIRFFFALNRKKCGLFIGRLYSPQFGCNSTPNVGRVVYRCISIYKPPQCNKKNVEKSTIFCNGLIFSQ